MKTTQSLLTACLITMLMLLQTAAAQSLDQLPLTKRISVLDDKAFLNFPGMAVDEYPADEVVGEVPLRHFMTVATLRMGDMRMEFWAMNRFCFGEEDPLAEERKNGVSGSDMREVLLDQDGLLAILQSPVAFDSTKERIFLNRLIVRTQENLMFQIGVYINPAAFPRRSELIQLSENVFRTLSKGMPDKALTARQEKYAIAETGKAFVFDLPAHFYIMKHRNRSLQTFMVRAYDGGVSDTVWKEIIVSVSDDPDVRWEEEGLAEKDCKKTKGNLLGNKIDWRQFTNKWGSYIREQVIPLEQVGPGLKLHVYMFSNQEVLFEELTEIAESIRLVDL